MQLRADRLDRDAWIQQGERAMPGLIVADGSRMHHGGQEDVDHRAGFGSREPLRADADDLVNTLTHVEGLPENVRVLAEAARPVIVREDGEGVGARMQIVSLREQAAQRGPESEFVEHPAGDVLEIHLLDFPPGLERHVHLLRVGDREQLRLALHGGAHPLVGGIGPSIEGRRLAVEANALAIEHVEPRRAGHRQGAQQKRVDQTEGRAWLQRRAPGRVIAAREVTFFFINWRQPKTASARSESSHGRQADIERRLALAERGAERAGALPSGSCAFARSRVGDAPQIPRRSRGSHHARERRWRCGKTGTYQQLILSTRPTADVTACHRSSSAPSCFRPAVVNS